MDGAKIREYASLMKELGLTGMEINEKKGTIRLEREPGVCFDMTDDAAAKSEPGAAGISKTVSGRVDESDESSEERPFGTKDIAKAGILSPMVGVFYTSPAKDEEPFVSPGDVVKKGQVICIIESMKLMNEIQAEEDCVISEVCVEDGHPVEYGTRLFSVTARGADC